MHTVKLLNDLSNFELTLSRAVLIDLFGDLEGNRLWDAFMAADESFLRFWTELDVTQQPAMIGYLNKIYPSLVKLIEAYGTELNLGQAYPINVIVSYLELYHTIIIKKASGQVNIKLEGRDKRK